MARQILPVVSIAVLLVACGPTMNIAPEMRRQAAATPILTSEQVSSRKYSILGEVVGSSCAVQAGSSREELKIKAAALSADAVTNALCKEGGIDLGQNCWKSIECRGDAIKWRP